MADARAAACLAVLTDAADQISETNHRVGQWSVEEHQLYVSGVGRYGKRWTVIAWGPAPARKSEATRYVHSGWP